MEKEAPEDILPLSDNNNPEFIELKEDLKDYKSVPLNNAKGIKGKRKLYDPKGKIDNKASNRNTIQKQKNEECKLENGLIISSLKKNDKLNNNDLKSNIEKEKNFLKWKYNRSIKNKEEKKSNTNTKALHAPVHDLLKQSSPKNLLNDYRTDPYENNPGNSIVPENYISPKNIRKPMISSISNGAGEENKKIEPRYTHGIFNTNIIPSLKSQAHKNVSLNNNAVNDINQNLRSKSEKMAGINPHNKRNSINIKEKNKNKIEINDKN